MKRRYEFAIGLAVGWAATSLALLPQLRDERDAAARLRAHEREIAHRCTFLDDGSATCPAGTFYVGKPQ